MKLRVESDGTPYGTKIINTDTGEDISTKVFSLEFYIDPHEVKTTLELAEGVEMGAELDWGTTYIRNVANDFVNEAYKKSQREPMRVGFVGKMGVGKTTLAKAVMEKYVCTKLSFAEPVKKIPGMVEKAPYHALMRLARELLPDADVNTRRLLVGMWIVDCLTPGLTKRERLQRVGTDSGRSIDKDIWVRHGIKKVEEGIGYVVDDVRFVNEAEALKDHGFKIVKLTAPNFVRRNRIIVRDKLSTFADPLRGSEHPSEVEQDQIVPDYELDTNDELHVTKKALSMMLEQG